MCDPIGPVRPKGQGSKKSKKKIEKPKTTKTSNLEVGLAEIKSKVISDQSDQ